MVLGLIVVDIFEAVEIKRLGKEGEER